MKLRRPNVKIFNSHLGNLITKAEEAKKLGEFWAIAYDDREKYGAVRHENKMRGIYYDTDQDYIASVRSLYEAAINDLRAELGEIYDFMHEKGFIDIQDIPMPVKVDGK